MTYAALAQLVEQRFCKAKVVSSSLTSGSIKKENPITGFSFLLFFLFRLLFVRGAIYFAGMIFKIVSIETKPLYVLPLITSTGSCGPLTL